MAILSEINLKNTLATIKEKITGFYVKPSKKRLAVVFILTLILFLVPFHPAQAGFLEDLVTTALFFGPYILIWLFTGLAVIFVYIATFLVDAALAPGIYMAIINSAAIDRGWTIMRDTANLFFILILIFIALATTLRLQSYSAKTWIPKLLFGAVFINFSKTITMFIIDIGNMFMYGAISWMGQGIKNTGIWQLTDTVNELFWHVSPFQWQLITITKMVEVFTAFMFSLILALTLLGFGILLLVRVTMLAILTIFSPIAFMLHAWPNAGKYANQWWGSLLKYIIFGPIIVFFLFIAGEMALTLFNMGAFTAAPTGIVGPTTGDMAKMSVDMGAFSTFFGSLIPFVIVIVILLSGLSFTTEMGIAGAGMIMGTVKGLAAGGGLIVGGLAAKSVFNKVQRGANWAKGDWSKGTRKAIKDKYGKSLDAFSNYGKKVSGKIPGGKYGQQFAGGVWSATGGNVLTAGREIKDQAFMAYSKHQEAERKKAEERATKLNLSDIDAQKRRDASQSAEEAAGYTSYLQKKGKSFVDRSEENRLATEVEEKEKKMPKAKIDADNYEKNELKPLKESLEKEKERNLEKEQKVIEIAMRGGIDKGELANSRPDLAPIINGKSTKEQMNKMIDDGYSMNKMNKDALRNEKVINGLRDDVYKNDPERFKTFMDSLGSEKRNIAKETMKGMVEGLKDSTGKINMDTGDTEGLKNFHTAATLAILQEKNLDKVFGGAADFKDAMEDFTKHYWRDLTKFSQEKDQLLIAQHIGPDTLQQFGKRDLNPAERRNFVKFLIDVHTGKNTAGIKADKTDALETIRDREVWKSCLKKTDTDYIKTWNSLAKKGKMGKGSVKKTTMAEKLEEEEEEETTP